MGRHAVRTREVSLDAVVRIKALFGTTKNGWRKLGLEAAGMKFEAVFYRAMNNLPVAPQDAEQIEEAWANWRERYLHADVPVSSMFELTPEIAEKGFTLRRRSKHER